VVEHLPSVSETLGSASSPAKKKKERKEKVLFFKNYVYVVNCDHNANLKNDHKNKYHNGFVNCTHCHVYLEARL
jgi:hypothetical protein